MTELNNWPFSDETNIKKGISIPDQIKDNHIPNFQEIGNDLPHSKSNNKVKENQQSKVSFFKLLSYSTRFDYLLMTVGAIAAMINGLALPAFSLIFGSTIDAFGPSSSVDDLVQSVGNMSLYLLYAGLGSFVLSWIQMASWMISGERQAIQIRKEYFKAVISQEIGWFDTNNPNELQSKISSETFQIQGAIGEKVPTFIMTVFMVLGGFGVGYARGWQMALVSTAALPFLTIGAISFALVIQTSQKKIAGSYMKAGGLAEQAFNSIKTIKSLTGEDHELQGYQISLQDAFQVACKFGIWAGVGLGLTFLTMFLDYGVSFWYGSTLIEDGVWNSSMNRNYTVGDVFVIFFAIMVGGFSLGQIGPCLKSFAIGQQAGKKVLEIIQRTPLITIPPNPLIIKNLKGEIIFNDVKFNYPTKADLQVFPLLNLKIKANEKTALVGESGCGKSTVFQLLLRFYDPISGSITIDGNDVKTLDYHWLRRNVGYVGQEPILFDTSIRENLLFGKEEATEEEMVQALKQANAWEFVELLEKKLDTFVGNAGSQISGGQKQRICIARAILKNPQILLLDEATSALDRKNESMIQKTLDEISKGRTTIVIAHRLSTIKNADSIIVLEKGKFIEQGKFEDLILAGGKFQAFAKNQMQAQETEDTQQNKEQEYQQFPFKKDPFLVEINLGKTVQSPRSSLIQDSGQVIDKSKNAKDKAIEKKIQKYKEKDVMKRLHQMNKSEQVHFYIGSLFALANGVIFPFCGYILGQSVSVFSDPKSPNFRSEANLVAIAFIIIAVAAFIFTTFQQAIFTRVGEGLTLRIRREVFWKILRMPGGWFDKVENNPSVLSARLTTDAHLVNGLTSTIVSIQIQNISSLISGLIIAFIHSWMMSFVALGISPIMIIAGQVQAKFVQGFSADTDSAYKESGLIVMESVTNIRTVASFSNEKRVVQIYASKLKQPYETAIKKGNIAGLTFGFSQFAMFGVYAVIFICGALFVRDQGLSIKNMFISIFAILFAAFGIGNANQFMGDVGAAKTACKKLFEILDTEDELQLSEKNSSNQVFQRVEGDIEFRKVTFKYPTRQATVFKDLSFQIKKGEKVAFVGHSGSGKSSIMQLLLRFYDNYEGQIFIDGKNIREYQMHEFRKSFGVVSQEPVLFNGTISDNIKYNTINANFEDIKEAARQANALGFIEAGALESREVINKQKDQNSQISGFNLQVGLKGNQISGGQKQRIAIARAVIKNPNILLLDEATSALDHENEKIVQEALNQVMKGKTSLCVAHRISTIQDSDQIFVIEDGKLVEQGTFEQLMANKSYFYRLNAF